MSTVRALRHSGLARKGLLALVVLAYLIYTAGTLLEIGIAGLIADFPYVRIGASTAGLIVAGLLISSFFVTEPEEPDEGDEDG